MSRPNRLVRLVLPACLALAALACNALSFGDSQDPTSAPAPTEAPATEPTEAAPSAAQPSSGLTIADGECANPLFPLDIDNQWLYEQNVSGQGTPDPNATAQYSIEWTVHDVSAAAAVVELVADPFPLQATYELRCQQGALLSFPAVTMKFAASRGDQGEVDLTYEHVAGEYLPSVETFEAQNWDHAWETELLISGQAGLGAAGTPGTTAVFGDSPWTIQWTTAGAGDQAFEAVSVPAGDFSQALLLEQTLLGQVVLGMEGAEFSAQFETLSHHWYVREVGLVKTETVSTDLTFEGASLPMTFEDLDQGLVLTEYGKAGP